MQTARMQGLILGQHGFAERTYIFVGFVTFRFGSLIKSPLAYMPVYLCLVRGDIKLSP